ncbi:MAG: Lrp/AsnC ligand binding domain-containing protein [Emcibacteraceae bacterium]|jgi:Lrp/AsnC family leucine-responsive transcriptional regulator|uniref:Lrp/AsnC ligand binding domain-containing protein n=1 Tax=Pseudemcibacter sp. TaxID=2943293 RepID=UPI002308DF9E|nr:winged helix-turn-helix transcriptional regulator [Kordiimonadaceae bacterium]MDA7568535.1 Lrp/AsnC ligand binding domain-containing protein [Emcibacteraceae bacterium]MDA9180621.1 Lrp/AsnC ligand binding domain-containing protein [Emcibacteraceae bacterium]MDA9554184.1 Lrp/AsnC ligand binding domain-containing protein [Emcibacteraceae bacterium]MDG1021585.1 Lrp/AsnC ligand binding domain-containing protein [Emcibacteraceae bacterium]
MVQNAIRKLDKIDRKILQLLQKDGRISNVKLADMIHLSPTPCLERVKRLEKEGYIKNYVAILNPKMLNAALVSFIEVSLDRTTTEAFDAFSKEVLAMDEVQECHMVAGGFDYLIKVRTSDMEHYRMFLAEKLSTIGGIKNTHTYVVMEEIKASNAINVSQ